MLIKLGHMEAPPQEEKVDLYKLDLPEKGNSPAFTLFSSSFIIAFFLFFFLFFFLSPFLSLILKIYAHKIGPYGGSPTGGEGGLI